MKKGFMILGFLLTHYAVTSQYVLQNRKADYQWLMGYYDIQFAPNGWLYDFNQNPMSYRLVNKLLKGDLLTANVCNKEGNLAFYTNGCRISDAQNRIIQGGDTINNGNAYIPLCNGGNSYSPTQGTVILPSMTDDSSYYMFHLRQALYIDSRTGVVAVDDLLLTKIVKKGDGYRVIFKDSVVLDYKNDSLLFAGQLTACRHANGRDWWIISPKYIEKDYYALLFTPNGLIKKLQKNIGLQSPKTEYGGGMAVFSPDGKKYVRYNFLTDAQIFDFDRCTGKLSNFKHIPIKDDADETWAAGCAISPNSRFLYLASSTKLYQYDLWSDSILNTKFTFDIDTTLIDTTGSSPLYPLFYTCQLGANGKIYIANTASKSMHVIEKPDLKGAACELKQNGITLPIYITGAIPFFPNFRLGAEKGSSCDTLTTALAEADVGVKGKLSLYPNPAHDIVKIDMTLDEYGDLDKYTLRVVDIVGRVQSQYPLSNFASIKEISVLGLANGLYFVQLVDRQGRVVANSKVVVAH